MAQNQILLAAPGQASALCQASNVAAHATASTVSSVARLTPPRCCD